LSAQPRNSKRITQVDGAIIAQQCTKAGLVDESGSDSISRWLLFGTTGLDVYGQSHSKW